MHKPSLPETRRQEQRPKYCRKIISSTTVSLPGYTVTSVETLKVISLRVSMTFLEWRNPEQPHTTPWAMRHVRDSIGHLLACYGHLIQTRSLIGNLTFPHLSMHTTARRTMLHPSPRSILCMAAIHGFPLDLAFGIGRDDGEEDRDYPKFVEDMRT